jgi:putative transposase
MIAFIEELRSVFGVGPICRVLGIAPSTYYEHKAVERDPDRASTRAKRDAMDKDAIKRVFEASRDR